MKRISGRQYKHDLSDVVGVLVEHQALGVPLTLADIQRAVVELYGSWDKVPTTSHSFILAALEHPNLSEVYEGINHSEQEAKQILISFEERYPGVTTTSNVEKILDAARSNAISKNSLLEDLKAKRGEKRNSEI